MSFISIKKRVIIATRDQIYPSGGGASIRCLKIGEIFKKKGFEVTYLGPSTINKLGGDKICPITSPCKEFSVLLSTMIFNLKILFLYPKDLIINDTYIVHNTTPAIPFYLFRIFFRKKRFILDITDLHSEILFEDKINSNFMERFFLSLIKRFEYYLLNTADKLIVVSKAMKEHCITNGGVRRNDIKIVYDGAQVNTNSNIRHKFFGKNILFIGTIDRQQCVHHLIMAIPLVIKQDPNVHFTIIGTGREFLNIIKLAEELDINTYITFTGYLPHEEALSYYRKCDIGVVIRGQRLSNHLVVTIKIFEYWASRIGVIAPRLRGISEIAEDYKEVIFYEPDNYIDLADKINSLIKNRNKLDYITEQAYIKVQKFNWPFLMEQFYDYIEAPPDGIEQGRYEY